MGFLQCAKLLKVNRDGGRGLAIAAEAIFTDQTCVRLRSAVATPWKPTERQTQIQALESLIKKAV